MCINDYHKYNHNHGWLRWPGVVVGWHGGLAAGMVGWRLARWAGTVGWRGGLASCVGALFVGTHVSG